MESDKQMKRLARPEYLLAKKFAQAKFWTRVKFLPLLVGTPHTLCLYTTTPYYTLHPYTTTGTHALYYTKYGFYVTIIIADR